MQSSPSHSYLVPGEYLLREYDFSILYLDGSASIIDLLWLAMGGFMINDVEDESRRLVMEIVRSRRL